MMGSGASITVPGGFFVKFFFRRQWQRLFYGQTQSAPLKTRSARPYYFCRLALARKSLNDSLLVFFVAHSAKHGLSPPMPPLAEARTVPLRKGLPKARSGQASVTKPVCNERDRESTARGQRYQRKTVKQQ
jgi:hypothetical protein